MPSLFADPSAPALPIHACTPASFAALTLDEADRRLAAAAGFDGAPGRIVVLAGGKGAGPRVLFGAPGEGEPMLAGKLATTLGAGAYRFVDMPRPEVAALAWLLSSYRFTRYKAARAAMPTLVAPEGVDTERVERMARAVWYGRDLVNTPANDLGPDALAQALRDTAAAFGAACVETVGADLEAGFPLIAAVGRAAAEPPRLMDITWGDPSHPKVTLVGKGVTFDTGGLDIKPSASMLLMKKDMGGAATAIAAARMVMDARLPVRLRLLVPIVENAIAGDAFRPGDVLASRQGLSVEIGNTDAEGRLILADTLALASEDEPALLLDFATLTGAARVALGPDLPPFYTGDDALAVEIARHGDAAHDPVWRLPLWNAYDALLDSKVADINNTGGPFAGSITAALFLRRFVRRPATWAHFDVYNWSPSAKPGRPEGGETQVARLVYDLLDTRYGHRP